jgi:hypothetical protein
MRLISAGSLVRAQSGPVFARVVSRERRLSRRSLGEGGPVSPCGPKRRELRLGKPALFRIGDCGLGITRRHSKLELNKGVPGQ